MIAEPARRGTLSRLMMRRPISRIFLAFVLVFFAAAFFAPDGMAEERSGSLYWTPENATEGGQKVDQILDFIFWLTLAVFVLTQGVYIYYLIRYRRKKGVKAHYSHGNNRLEMVWTLTPTLIFLSLAIWGDRVWFELTNSEVPKDAITVEVVGYQFAWDLRYPGADGRLDDTALEKISNENKFGLTREDPELSDDFNSAEMVIPVGRPVHILLRSRDVIHSFYVPEFRLYQDAVPGRTIDWIWFTTTRTGNFQLACSQLCGSGHYNMKAPITVVSQDEYDKWYAAKVKSRGEQIAGLKDERESKAVALK